MAEKVRVDGHCHLFNTSHLAAAAPIPKYYAPVPQPYTVRDHAQALLNIDSTCKWVVVNAHLSVFPTSDHVLDSFTELANLQNEAGASSQFDYSRITVLGIIGAEQALANPALLSHSQVIGCRLCLSKQMPDLNSPKWQSLFQILQSQHKFVDIYCRLPLDQLERAIDVIPKDVPLMIDHFGAFAPTPSMERYSQLLRKLRERRDQQGGAPVVLKGPGYRSSLREGFTTARGIATATPFATAAAETLGKEWCLTHCSDAPHVLGFRNRMAIPHASDAFAFVKGLEERVDSQLGSCPGKQVEFGGQASSMLLSLAIQLPVEEGAHSCARAGACNAAAVLNRSCRSSGSKSGSCSNSISPSVMYADVFRKLGFKMHGSSISPSVMYDDVFRKLGFKMLGDGVGDGDDDDGSPREVTGKKDWVTPSCVAIVFWGVWGFLSNVGGKLGLDAAQANLVKYAGIYSTLPLLTVLNSKSKTGSGAAGAGGEPNGQGEQAPSSPLLDRPKLALLSSFFSGVCNCAAGLFLARAMERGEGGTVSTVTACYAPVTMGLGAMFLEEVVTKNKVFGLVFAILAQYFFIRS